MSSRNAKEVRDKGTGVRINCGFTQDQNSSERYTDSKGSTHSHLKLPLVNTGDITRMGTPVCNGLGNILKYFQSVHLIECSGAMNNYGRSKLTGPRFGDVCWPGMNILWEYLNISVRSVKDELRMHMDYFNDRQKGYNHTVVYSYLVTEGGLNYRVTLVMTFRRSWGSFMDKILQV